MAGGGVREIVSKDRSMKTSKRGRHNNREHYSVHLQRVIMMCSATEMQEVFPVFALYLEIPGGIGNPTILVFKFSLVDCDTVQKPLCI